MSVDFGDAHIRHWKDAELLYCVQHLANADHLYGMAAECGLKRHREAAQIVRNLLNTARLNGLI